MENKKIIIAVLSADIQGYSTLMQAVKETWGTSKPDGYEILYYYGYRNNYPKPSLNSVLRIGDDLICGLDENMVNINVKNYLAFKYIYDNFNFEYLFRPCAGSYLNLSVMDKWIANRPKQQFYSGIVGSLGNVSFASGSGFFLSRDLVKLLIDTPSSFICHPSDDVAIGKFLTDRGIKIYPGERQDIVDITHIDKNHYHYHFRHNTDMMRAIHKVIRG